MYIHYISSCFIIIICYGFPKHFPGLLIRGVSNSALLERVRVLDGE